MDDTLLELVICRIPGLKGNERIRLVKEVNRIDDFLSLSKGDIENKIERFLGPQPLNMKDALAKAEKDAGLCARSGMRRVSWREQAYPPLLREIFDPPLVLFYRGSLPDPEKPMVAVVGTRKHTPMGAQRAFNLGRDLGEAGIPVVSGLALGIDSMAHRGNIEGKAATVAVLGSGADMIFPASNRDLARRILETGGAIVSEYPPGTEPARWTYPARNRIISALARGVVIVEAPEKSGALITAQFALDQGRDLWVDSYGAESANGAGTARLAEDGAAVISSADDILAEWKISKREKGKDMAHNSAAGLASSMAEYLDINL